MCSKHFLFLFLFLISGIVSAFTTELIHIELWTELDPVSLAEGESKRQPTETEAADNLTAIWKKIDPIPVAEDESIKPISQKEAFTNLLSEAKTILSAMIYGVTFSYIPADKAHGVKEFFEMKPIAEIKWGDTNLNVESTELAENRIYVRITYLLEDFQEKRRESWFSIQIPSASGTGEGTLFKGMQEKYTALTMSLKDAVHNLLHTRIINKPREIRGMALLEKNPHTIIKAGMYITTASFKILVKEIIPYTVF